MDNILAIALAGAAGAVSRYWVTRAVFNWLGTGYPYGTLLVNISGSLLLGFFSILFLQKLAVPEPLRFAVLVGFLGAFTTFSTFSYETLFLLEQGQTIKAVSYVLISVIACVLAAWGGVMLARIF